MCYARRNTLMRLLMHCHARPERLSVAMHGVLWLHKRYNN
jgi:hypothetical protein